MSHLRHAVRKLSQTPGFTILSVITLASGIAASTAIFGVVNGVLLLPLPFPDAHRLVSVTHDAPGLDLEDLGQADATFLHYQSHSRALESIALFDTIDVTLTGLADPQRLVAARAPKVPTAPNSNDTSAAISSSVTVNASRTWWVGGPPRSACVWPSEPAGAIFASSY